MLKANRFGEQPSSEVLGIDIPEMPLHIKKVPPMDLSKFALLRLPRDLEEQWLHVKQWIDGKHPEVPFANSPDAKITAAELAHRCRSGRASRRGRRTCSLSRSSRRVGGA
eukprot:PhM_4_TR11644/c3_g1_i2/m.68018